MTHPLIVLLVVLFLLCCVLELPFFLLDASQSSGDRLCECLT